MRNKHIGFNKHQPRKYFDRVFDKFGEPIVNIENLHILWSYAIAE